MNNDRIKGPVMVLLASFLWSIAGICTKFIPWGPISISCVRGVLAAITIGVFTKQWFFKPTPAIILGAFGTAGTSLLFMAANKLTTASNAIIMQYTAPVFVILFSILFLKMKPSCLDFMTVIVTLGGISLFFIEHLGRGEILGDIFGILSGITFSLVFFANRLPGADPMKASYLGCLVQIVFIPFLFFDNQVGSSSTIVIIVMLAMGIFQMGMAYIIFSFGIRRTEVVTASIIAMIEPILNPVWVFLLMGESPGPLALAGAVIVITTIIAYSVFSVRKVLHSHTKNFNANLKKHYLGIEKHYSWNDD